MVSKQNLQEELNSFNKQLEKHLQGIGVDLLDDSSFNTSSLSGENSETLLLLTQSLKDIRMEMNLMRKHLSSDTEVMLKSLLGSQQRQFQEEMRSFQERTFKILKVFDPSVLKEISSEISRVSQEQTSIKSEILSLKNTIGSKSKESSILDLKLEVEPMFMDITSRQEKIESQITTLFSREQNKLENFEMILKDTLDSFNNAINSKQNKTIDLISSTGLKTKQNLSNLNKKIQEVEQYQQNSSITIANKISKLDKKLHSTKKDLLENSNDSEKFIFEKLSHLEEDILSSKDNIHNIDSKIHATFDELKSLEKQEKSSICGQKEKSLNSKSKVIDLKELEQVEVMPLESKNKILDIEARLRKLSMLK